MDASCVHYGLLRLKFLSALKPGINELYKESSVKRNFRILQISTGLMCIYCICAHTHTYLGCSLLLVLSNNLALFKGKKTFTSYKLLVKYTLYNRTALLILSHKVMP